MKTSIIKIGNSQGIRIPKPIIEQCSFEGEIDLEVHNNELIIRTLKNPRDNWEAEFISMSSNKDDIAHDMTSTKWDKEEWEWK